jgi:hypothetical protein
MQRPTLEQIDEAIHRAADAAREHTRYSDFRVFSRVAREPPTLLVCLVNILA